MQFDLYNFRLECFMMYQRYLGTFYRIISNKFSAIFKLFTPKSIFTFHSFNITLNKINRCTVRAYSTLHLFTPLKHGTITSRCKSNSIPLLNKRSYIYVLLVDRSGSDAGDIWGGRVGDRCATWACGTDFLQFQRDNGVGTELLSELTISGKCDMLSLININLRRKKTAKIRNGEN